MKDEIKEIDKFATEKLLSGTTNTQVTNQSGLIWSCPGSAFMAAFPDIADINTNVDNNGILRVDADTNVGILTAPVNLPNGATIKSAVVFGSDSTETWGLYKRTLSVLEAGTVIANSTINSSDTANDVVDNSTFCYWLETTSTLEINDAIYGARINYQF